MWLKLLGGSRSARMRTAKVLHYTNSERRRQDEKWGPLGLRPPTSPLLWNAVLGEEFGEVSECCCEIEWAERNGDAEDLAKWQANLKMELIQVAAVATAWVEDIEGECFA